MVEAPAVLLNAGGFPLETGVKQGGVMFDFLFNIIIWLDNEEHKQHKERFEMEVYYTPCDQAFFFSRRDDIALLSSRHKDLQEECNRLHQVSGYTSLHINTTKTKVLRTNGKVANPISINGQDAEEVSSFIYLEATVWGESWSHEDIKRRLSIAILSGGQAARRFPPKMSKKNPLDSHTISNCGLYERVRERDISET